MSRRPEADRSQAPTGSASAEQQLIAHVGRERDRSLQQIGETAREDAAALLAEARHRARRRVGEAVAEERRRAERELRGVRAQVETRLRQRFHEVTGELLRRTWPLVEQALEHRWQAPETRRQWIAEAVELARRRLPAGDWSLEHPPALAEQELAEAIAGVAAVPGSLTIRSVPSETLRAGLRIRCAGACLDASAVGLMTGAERISGMLLAHLEQAQALPEHAAGQAAKEP